MRRVDWRQVWHARRGDAAALSVIALFFALFFGGPVVRGRFLVAADAFYQSYPFRTVAWGMIRAGQLPLWTPHLFAGYPFLSMGQLSLGYPLSWGYLVLPGRWAEQIYVLAPYLLAPAFTYFYARTLGRSRLAALLAGLAYGFGGGMVSKLGVVGFHTNAFTWLPLLLIPIERARAGRFVPCLLGAAGAYALALLNGYGQGFVYVGVVALLYAAFLSAADVFKVEHGKAATANETRARHDASTREPSWPGKRWLDALRPLAAAGGGMSLAAGVAAFQILESLRAVRRSVRSALAYEVFSAGSFGPTDAIQSFAAPLYHYVEVSVYVAPLAALLAAFAVARNFRRGRDPRVWFWLAVAVVAFLLMLGPATPLNRLAFKVPVFNLFRYPSRHAFEWSFALSVLAAYGWDALAAARERARADGTWTARHSWWLAPLALASSLAFGIALWLSAARRVTTDAPPDTGQGTTLTEPAYLWLKLYLTASVVAAVWLGFRLASPRLRAAVLAAAIFVACFFEPLAAVSCWWFPDAKTAARFTEPSEVTRLLQTFPPEQNRVYTRVNLYLVHGYPQPRPPLDLPNLTALHGLHNVAGYEQLVLERFSRALGDVGPDAVNKRYGVRGDPDPTHFSPRSHVLDLLNVTHVATFDNLSTAPAPRRLVEREGISFDERELNVALAPGETVSLAAGGASGDTLALVTAMAGSIEVADGARVAALRIALADGVVVERPLRAGADTAEWAHERADVRAVVKHARAHVFDSGPGDEANSFSSHRYLARVHVGARAGVSRVEITNTSAGAHLVLSKASVHDSASGQSAVLRAAPQELDARRWEPIFDRDGVTVLRNHRALPRAWLVGEAEAVDGEEALKLIRGEGAREFDPRRTALLEVGPAELPALPAAAPVSDAGGKASEPASLAGGARIASYEPNRIVVETDAPAATVLVLGEIFYPGWEATVDGEARPIMLTNFLLRGVPVPAGRHTVEMRYRAPAARAGALVSLAALACAAALFARSRRASGAAGRADV